MLDDGFVILPLGERPIFNDCQWLWEERLFDDLKDALTGLPVRQTAFCLEWTRSSRENLIFFLICFSRIFLFMIPIDHSNRLIGVQRFFS